MKNSSCLVWRGFLWWLNYTTIQDGILLFSCNFGIIYATFSRLFCKLVKIRKLKSELLSGEESDGITDVEVFKSFDAVSISGAGSGSTAIGDAFCSADFALVPQPVSSDMQVKNAKRNDNNFSFSISPFHCLRLSCVFRSTFVNISIQDICHGTLQ